MIHFNTHKAPITIFLLFISNTVQAKKKSNQIGLDENGIGQRAACAYEYRMRDWMHN